ncbi:hypothetical protein Ais01nite_61690 [Asanoa ishikariensis]|uniref:Uncharacterized protein n=1 Tax=Asanoa ishikariensis TaxID=137265 RepID=A0A1H3P4M6_9ACTN|nr:hypothetical protein [Asanoa ishikariensis]GIF68134.1 hypothetical protein Ais01nite_61690 [Asanoa ishikariensis]SDY95775.1 hypothetical protein SAMN05421684_2559 [Asanoa ishikariensis]
MRRLATVVAATAAALWISAPASAFAHANVVNPYLHTALDVLTVGVVTAPLWTAYFWTGRRLPLVALIAIVQVPVAVFGFVQIPNPFWHAAALVAALTLTLFSLVTVRRLATAHAGTAVAAPATAPAD